VLMPFSYFFCSASSFSRWRLGVDLGRPDALEIGLELPDRVAHLYSRLLFETSGRSAVDWSSAYRAPE